MSSHDDARLVRECLDGHVGAFAELVDRYQKALYNSALRITGNQEDAKDVTQTVFVKAYNNLERYRSEFKFFSWIYRILINESVNCIKQRRTQVGLESDFVDTRRRPDEQYVATVLGERIDEALRELPFDSRIVIVLRHFNDMGYQEMGDILFIAAKTVKSRLYTARRALADILEQKGVVSW